MKPGAFYGSYNTHMGGGGNVHTGAIELIHNLLSGLHMYYYSKHIIVQHTGKVILVMARKN